MEVWVAMTRTEWDALREYTARTIASGEWQTLKRDGIVLDVNQGKPVTRRAYARLNQALTD